MDFEQKTFPVKVGEETYNMAYTECGAQHSNILLCVHGLTRNSRDFDYVANQLSGKYRVLCLDILGRGESDWLKDESLYNYQTYFKIVLEFIDSLDKKKIDYLGTSMGGIIGMMIAANRPELFGNLILNDIGYFIPREPLLKIAKYISIHPKFNNFEEALEHIKTIMAPFGIKKEDDWRYITKHSIKQTDDGLFVLSYDPAISTMFAGLSRDEIQDFNIEEIWKKLSFNKLLILRGKKSGILEETTAQQMVTSKPNIKLVEFTDVGHAPALMEQDQINAILDWI